jgi:hypothetical protein
MSTWGLVMLYQFIQRTNAGSLGPALFMKEWRGKPSVGAYSKCTYADNSTLLGLVIGALVRRPIVQAAIFFFPSHSTRRLRTWSARTATPTTPQQIHLHKVRSRFITTPPINDPACLVRSDRLAVTPFGTAPGTSTGFEAADTTTSPDLPIQVQVDMRSDAGRRSCAITTVAAMHPREPLTGCASGRWVI